MIRFFEASLAENSPHKSQPLSRPEGTSFARDGHNMAPVRGQPLFGVTSPLFSYPCERSREVLHQLEHSAPLDP